MLAFWNFLPCKNYIFSFLKDYANFSKMIRSPILNENFNAANYFKSGVGYQFLKKLA